MLVRALNDGVKGGSVKFSYDPVTQKVCVHMKGDNTFMLYGDLPDILGFGSGDGVVIRTTITNRKTLTQGESIVDLRRGFESLYVYSSVVEPRIVGDKIAPLLRIVPITGRHGEMATARFQHVQYIPVLSSEFGSIETEIRDDTGRPVPFERGKVTVTLHFRRCSSGLTLPKCRLLYEVDYESMPSFPIFRYSLWLVILHSFGRCDVSCPGISWSATGSSAFYLSFN